VLKLTFFRNICLTPQIVTQIWENLYTSDRRAYSVVQFLHLTPNKNIGLCRVITTVRVLFFFGTVDQDLLRLNTSKIEGELLSDSVVALQLQSNSQVSTCLIFEIGMYHRLHSRQEPIYRVVYH